VRSVSVLALTGWCSPAAGEQILAVVGAVQALDGGAEGVLQLRHQRRAVPAAIAWVIGLDRAGGRAGDLAEAVSWVESLALRVWVLFR